MGLIRTLLHHLTLGFVESDEQIEQEQAARSEQLRKEREEEERENRRKSTPLVFDAYLSFEDFRNLAINIAKPIKRLSVTVDRHFVLGKVVTVSGADYWTFKLDFNDFGKITGNCWIIDGGNPDSTIPVGYAKQLRDAIMQLRKARNANDFDQNGEDFFCPNCHADLRKQAGFDGTLDKYTCKSCGQVLFNPNIYSGDKFEDVYWYCDGCGTLLNKQKGFKDNFGFWYCSECGYRNDISEDNIINNGKR